MRSGAWIALVGVALSLPTLVNPINLYVSLLGALACAALAAISGRRVYGRAAPAGLALGAGLIALALLQEPLLLRKTGPGGLPCRIFSSSIPFCGWDARMLELARNVAPQTQLRPSAHDLPLEGYWPAVVSDWRTPLYPAHLRPFATRTAAGLASLLLCLPLLAGMWALGWRRAALCLAAAGGALLSVRALAAGEVWFVYQFGEKQIRHMLSSYTDLAYLNLWQPLFYVALLGSALVTMRWVARQRSRLAYGCAAALAVVLLAGGARNYKEITRLRKRPDFGRSTSELASLYLGLRQHLRPDEVIMLPAMHFASFAGGVEEWVFPYGDAYALQLYTRNPVLYSFSGFWRPSALTLAEHFERICARDCSYLAAEGVEVLVDIPGRTAVCGLSVEEYARQAGCFDRGPEIHTPRGTVSAAIYRLKKAGAALPPAPAALPAR